MKTRLQKSVEYIQGYCEKQRNCERCKLYDEPHDRCMMSEVIPANWEYQEPKK